MSGRVQLLRFIRRPGVWRGLAFAAALVAGSAHGQPRQSAATPDVRSVMPAYWRSALHRTSGPGRVAALRADVLRRFPDLYGPFIAVPADADLGEYLDNVIPLEAEMRALEPLVGAEIRHAATLLEGMFGPLDATIYVAPSLFSSNGQVRWINSRPVIMFGLDVQAYVETQFFRDLPRHQLRAYIVHEFLHAYHYAANAEIARAAERLFAQDTSAPLYLNLWIEGLATCASRRLVGGSIERSLSQATLHRDVAPHVARIASELRSRLDSTSTDDRRDYFWLQGGRDDIPARSAYALGMLAADAILRRLTMREAMQLPGPAIRAELDRALAGLAAGGFAGDWSTACTAPLAP